MAVAKNLTILLVDDEDALRRAFVRFLKRSGYDVISAGSIKEGKDALHHQAVDIAFVDFRLPDGNGSELMRWLTENGKARVVYCITGHANVKTTVEVVQAGCVDVLEKPFEVDRLAEVVSQLGKRLGDRNGLDAWRAQNASNIGGENEELLDALNTIRNVADTDCTVLVTGESGTGKELCAKALHVASSRTSGPFVALNCAAIPDQMVESELFGHAKGAFTGAIATREGRILAADGGTLFLDEIGDMPLMAQAKLLRVLQDKTIIPVGSDRPISVDIRVVAATNRNLEQMVAEGTFRGDLYYRLNVIPVQLPPLRERGEDIVLLAKSFLTDANERNRRSVSGFEPTAARALMAYNWPGNVRELAHVIERAVLIKGSGKLNAKDLNLKRVAKGTLPTGMPAVPEGLDLRRAIDHVERRLIDEALERTGGNRTEAAALLGLNRTTLVEKIRKHTA